MRLFVSTFLILFPSLLAAGVADELSRQIRQAKLDPAECYRVRDIRFTRDEIKLYLNDGFLIFAKPVNGHRSSAVFSAEVEGGDAELLLMPPSRSERKSLAAFAKSPAFEEHFKQSVLVFTDDSAAELLDAVKSTAKKSAEMGNVMADQWNPVVSSILNSFDVRLVEDLLAPDRSKIGFFFAAFGGTPLGNFDVFYDPRSRYQISMGQIAFRNDRRYFDIWTNFEARSWRMGQRKLAVPDYKIDRVNIEATIDPDLTMKVVTRLHLTPARTERTISLDISQQMRVTEVKVDGAAGDAFYPESLRANLLRSAGNHQLLITTDHEFTAGKPVDLELRHEGKVIEAAGNDVYYVGSRGSWYPSRMLQFADFEVTFRYPKTLDLVATGDLVSEVVEGDTKISKRKTSAPVRLFGFNLGNYERTTLSRGGLTVEVCANKKLETALMPKPLPVNINPIPTPGFPAARGANRRPQEMVLAPPQPSPSPVSRLQLLAGEISATFDELAARLGKPEIRTLTVSPIPGRFGQGFPGLVYLSTMSYLNPRERPLGRNGGPMVQMFFSEILHGHELAHQWWGNGVASADYQDDWLMESLANYSALWVLERKKGSKTLDSVLEEYKHDLLRKADDGRTLESAGPLTMGHRLFSSQSPGAWSVVTYEKGTWIIHMLRRRLGDERFQKMLTQLYQRNLYHAISTDQFRETAREFLPAGSPDPKLESFFETWVNGTGIPSLKLSWTTSGKLPKVKLTGTITQTDVDEDFSAWVPVEVQVGRMKPIVQWVQTSSEAVQFTVNLPAAPTKVVLDPANATLARK